ncbi:MAG: iron ABC transporter ATP-binding protein [Phycisphaerae bacterium]|nr:iron ABC transporter ATP-binding protein [Phycisphaerae bacterium]
MTALAPSQKTTTETPDIILRVDNLTMRYPDQSSSVVDGLSFSVAKGEIFVLVGPSGCGKTTTLRLIAGFERADDGYVSLNGRVLEGPGVHVPPEKRGIGLVFQDYALMPHLDVLRNVMFGVRGVPRARRRAIATEVLWMLGMAGKERSKPHDLSGGEQQRVALARALAPWPQLILLDEPFSNLDAELRASTRTEIRDLIRKTGKSAVLVTHDQEEALSIADRIAVMPNGHIDQTGAPEAVYSHPRSAFTAQFLGRTNLLSAVATGALGDTPLGRVELDRTADGNVVVSIRPEHIKMKSLNPDSDSDDRFEGDGVSGRILSREFKGHDQTYRVRVGEQDVTVHLNCMCRYHVGEAVALQPSEPAAVVDGVHRADAPLEVLPHCD